MLARFSLAVVAVVAVTATTPAAPPDPAELAKRIDAYLAKVWADAEVPPAPLADDATFVRRVYLDMVGRIPTVAEARDFLADAAPNKRAKLVDKLVASGGHTRHAATFWRRVWVPQADTPQFARLADGFDEWVAARFAENARYDDLVRTLLTASRGPGRSRLPQAGAAPQTFISASENKPENLAANTARAFLGINLDCAQCHDHPFAKWSRNQFWQTAAFFTRPARRSDPDTGPTTPVRFEIEIDGTNRTVSAAVLTEEEVAWPKTLTPEVGPTVLAKWVTDRKNPFFAKNAVNRAWAAYFGLGIVEPLDDLGGDNPPSHPELLDELAAAFADSGYDLKYLSKALVLTRAYQASSVQPTGGSSEAHTRLFARMPVRGLTGEQLYDSLRVAAGLPAERDDLDPVRALRDRKQFSEDFQAERPATAQRSIIQSLALMNGTVTAGATDPTATPTLAAAADAPFLDTRGKVETLFLAAVGRPPTSTELDRLAKHVESGGSHRDPRKALGDVFWALLNSSEFNTNHYTPHAPE